MAELPLAGCRVVVTRETHGELGRLLAAAGAEVVHVPLIEIVEPADGGDALRRELDRLGSFDWLMVTSAAGASRVGRAAQDHLGVRLGAVGTATARRLAELAGRDVDLVPDRQIAESLADRFVERHARDSQRVLLALGDRAATTLADRLRASGHRITAVTAYRTSLRTPARHELESIAAADAVLFASGSAAIGFAEAIGPDAADHLPRHVVAIGPTTAAAAHDAALPTTAIASDHSLGGLVLELAAVWRKGHNRRLT